MKENSIEEALKKLSTGKKIKMYELLRTFKKEGIENFVITRKKYVDVILSDYKRLLKENEELKEDRKNNNEMIALAQNEILNYMSGYEDGKKHKMTAVAQVVENQQYYIVRKQMEKYEEHIKRLQKENEELKNQEATQRKINELLVQRYSNSISVQKVKDKIEELKINLVNMQGEELLIYESKIDVLQELLESEEIEMEEKYINKILNFADENINTAKELVINKEQANGIIKELQEDYTPNAIIRLKIAEYKERKAKCNDIETEVRLDVKIRAYEELLEKR